MKVLLLGGTGAIGENLRLRLASLGARVTVTSRRETPAQGGTQFIRGNAHDDRFLALLVEEHWDCIVDFMCYSTSSFSKRMPLLLRNTNQYVFLSSARVFARSEKELTEESPRLLDVCLDQDYLKTDEYALAKARQENMLFETGATNWTIVRPYITYANERLQLGPMEKESWLFRSLEGRSIVFSHDLTPRTTTLTHGPDVAQAIAGLAGNSKAVGERFNIACSHHRTWGDILAIYESVLRKFMGSPPPIHLIDLPSFLPTHSGLHQIIHDRVFDRWFDSRKILAFIPAMTFTTPEQGLREATETFLRNPRFLPIQGRDEGARDRLTGEHTALRHFQGWRSKASYWLARHGIT